MLLFLSLLPLLGPVALARPAAPHPSPHGKCPLFDSGLTPYASFVQYVDAEYNRRELDAPYTYFNPDFGWHEQGAGRGIPEAVKLLETLGWPTANVSYQSVVPPCSANKRAVMHYRFQAGDTVLAAMEMYRFEGPCVAEFWGVYQPIPANDTSQKDFFDDRLKAKAVVPKCKRN